MATLRNRRKLAAVSRETPENTRNSQSQSTLDPEMAQEYISQVSEKIGGRVTKKLSKEFSRTESRFLGALSKLDEFLLNPQVRTCSVAVPGTFRNSDSGNREPTGDRSLNDPCPEVLCSSHYSGTLNNSEVEDYPHSFFHISNRSQVLKLEDFSKFHVFWVYSSIFSGRQRLRTYPLPFFLRRLMFRFMCRDRLLFLSLLFPQKNLLYTATVFKRYNWLIAIFFNPVEVWVK